MYSDTPHKPVIISEGDKIRQFFLTLTISTHLTIDNPNPDIAPKRPATVWFMQRDAKSPTQLNTNATAIKNKQHSIITSDSKCIKIGRNRNRDRET